MTDGIPGARDWGWVNTENASTDWCRSVFLFFIIELERNLTVIII